MAVIVICPSCNGTTISETTGLKCQWCKGTKNVSPDVSEAFTKSEKRRRFDEAINGKTSA